VSIFEATMLFCFGLAWPMNIFKSLRSKTVKGKSLIFQVAVLIGYLAGIIHKILYSLDLVMVLYCINLTMVIIDTILYLYYKKADDKLATESQQPETVEA